MDTGTNRTSTMWECGPIFDRLYWACKYWITQCNLVATMTRLLEQLAHAKQYARIESGRASVFASLLQKLVQTLVKPRAVTCRVSVISAVVKKMKNQMVLRNEAIEDHHQGHVLAIGSHCIRPLLLRNDPVESLPNFHDVIQALASEKEPLPLRTNPCSV